MFTPLLSCCPSEGAPLMHSIPRMNLSSCPSLSSKAIYNTHCQNLSGTPNLLYTDTSTDARRAGKLNLSFAEIRFAIYMFSQGPGMGIRDIYGTMDLVMWDTPKLRNFSLTLRVEDGGDRNGSSRTTTVRSSRSQRWVMRAAHRKVVAEFPTWRPIFYYCFCAGSTFSLAPSWWKGFPSSTRSLQPGSSTE